MQIDEILSERHKTHGDFTSHATATQAIKDVLKGWPNWGSMSPVQKEALDMFAHKIGRILAGDPDYQDHWDDIAGYAKLVSMRLTKP